MFSLPKRIVTDCDQKVGEDSTVTMLSSCGSKYDDDTLDHGEHLPLDTEPPIEVISHIITIKNIF